MGLGGCCVEVEGLGGLGDSVVEREGEEDDVEEK